MNVFTCTGNLGKDAEVRNAGSTSVAGFSLAVKSGYGDKQQTMWLDCSIWGSRADSGLIAYLKKGQQVAVSGELGTREYNGKTYLTLRVSEISLCGGIQSAPAQPSAPAQNQPQSSAPAPAADYDDDVPF